MDAKSVPTPDFPDDLPGSLESPEAWQAYLRKQAARIRQLKREIASRQEENQVIVSENLRQNEALIELNRSLDEKIQGRTRELQASKEQLEEQNHVLKEINESKEAMMHMIVHDMKNPLTSIMGALCLSQNPKFELDTDLKELLKGAHIQAIKLRTMIDDILNISQMKSKEFTISTEPVDLISLAQQSLLLMNTVKGSRDLSLRIETAFSELTVDIDFQLIERVINNILNNAIKYAPEKSELLMVIDRDDAFARLSVTNWGEAIPASAHQKIFDIFGRAKPEDKSIQGTGLGLAFCKLAIEAHHGRIWVESPVPPHPKGARFYFTLPLHQ